MSVCVCECVCVCVSVCVCAWMCKLENVFVVVCRDKYAVFYGLDYQIMHNIAV